MTVVDPTLDPVPRYLETYAAELDQWRRDVRDARAYQSVPSELKTHPKDRALFARIAYVLAEYDLNH
jgi:hypothetical protein